MKWIKYQILQSVVDEGDVLVNKKVSYSEANIAIAEEESYNGEYEIVEDEKSVETKPLAIELGGTNAKTAAEAMKNFMPVTVADAGKFMRVSSTGEWVAESVPYAEGVSF